MRRFVEGVDRSQTTLFPESLDDWVDENNLVRAIDAFVDALDLRALGFDGVVPETTGRPSYHPAALLKLLTAATGTAKRSWPATRRE
jgi:transposase